MRRLFVCVSLAALLATGCGESGGGGKAESVRVDPGKVTAEDLQAAASDERVRRFYEGRDWAPVWSGAMEKELTSVLEGAHEHGINPESYLKDAREGASPVEREARLTLAALNYAQALSSGAVDPRKIFEVYEIPVNNVDVVSGLQKAVAAEGAVAQWFARLPPSDPEYKALQQAYMAYRQRAGQEQRAAIEAGGKIEVGDRDPRVPQIADGLRSNGYLPPAQAQPQVADAQKQAKGKEQPKAQPQSAVYTREMAEAVKKAQEDYGIKADGVIGNDTLEALNTGAKERARILAVNLERRRWLERTPPQTRIDVNTAAAHLHYLHDGQTVDRRRVVVGQPEWETPELRSPIVRLVANPPWTVPESIAEEEILPKGEAYMAKENISMKNGRLVQAPGPKSALGLVKFDMANKHAIYLHDTPAKALFSGTDRHASHGCVRVNDAVGFARLLADRQGKLAEFEKALATGEETPVQLPKDIPVRLLYHSAYFDGGKVVFRTDPYGWDDKLAQALGFEGQIRPKVKTHIQDVGP